MLDFSVRERVRDCAFLTNASMIAVAQKKHVYIYDQQGVELHEMKHHYEPKFLEYLPYHYLLVSGSKRGHIKYQDITTGTMIAEMHSHKGEPMAMTQNAQNCIIAVGHSYGGVTMWSPNFGKPMVEMLCHPSSVVSTVSFTHDGSHMITTGLDCKVKIWDT